MWQDHALSAEHDTCTAMILVSDACSLTAQTSKKTCLVDEKLVELEELDASIRGADSEMKVTTAAYEKSVQDRNAVGLMVIDRNDELSILYQKYNGQAEAIKSGTAILPRNSSCRPANCLQAFSKNAGKLLG